MKNLMLENNGKYYCNPISGDVDTAENWLHYYDLREEIVKQESLEHLDSILIQVVWYRAYKEWHTLSFNGNKK